MRVRAAALCALALLGLLPAVAGAAAPERGVLVVTGQGGTTGELVVTQQTRVVRPEPVVSGGGEYAGALVEPVGGPALLGAVVVRAFRDATRDVVSVVGADLQLEPGRYRVTLLGQGPVAVRWELQDRSVGLLAEPRDPLPGVLLGRSEPLAAGDGSASILLGRAVPPGKRVVQVALLDGTAVEDVRLCATGGTACDAPLPRLRVGTGRPLGQAVLHEAAATTRNLVWSSEAYYREAEGRLRAAAIVLG